MHTSANTSADATTMERKSASLSRCSSCMADLSRSSSCSNSNSFSATTRSTTEYQTTASTTASTCTSKLDLEPTKLFLSSSPTSILSGFTSATASTTLSTNTPERLYLPRRGSAPPETLDTYLSSLPSIQSRAEELWKCPNSNGNGSGSSSSSNGGNTNGTGHCCKQQKELVNNNSNSRDTQQQQHLSHQQCCLQLDQVAHNLRCVTVLQGEVAHATSEDTDLLLSGKATTCHVLAVRSTTTTSGTNNTSTSSSALNSIAHLDHVYSDCLDAIVKRHLQHHQVLWQVEGEDDYGFYMGDSQGTLTSQSLDGSHHFLPTPVMPPQPTRQPLLRSSSMITNHGPPQPSLQPATTTSSHRMIHMELHLVGGYLDAEGTSQGLTEEILRTLSHLADTYSNQIQMHLSTAAVSRLNTCHNTNTPKSRGLALNVHTGRVHPITTALPSELEGPALELRNARMFATNNTNSNSHSLAVIHDQGNIIIESFDYQPQQQLNALLQVPDPILLQVTSTSPHCESSRFCSDMRRTVSFLNRVPSDAVFRMGQPLVYTRSKTAGLNDWESSVEIPSFGDDVNIDDGITF